MEKKDWDNVYKTLESNWNRFEKQMKKVKRKSETKRTGQPADHRGFPMYGYGHGFGQNNDNDGDYGDMGDFGGGDGGGDGGGGE